MLTPSKIDYLLIKISGALSEQNGYKSMLLSHESIQCLQKAY